jgi:hypothetical protein
VRRAPKVLDYMYFHNAVRLDHCLASKSQHCLNLCEKGEARTEILVFR